MLSKHLDYLHLDESLEPDKDDPADEPLAVPNDTMEELGWYVSPFDDQCIAKLTFAPSSSSSEPNTAGVLRWKGANLRKQRRLKLTRRWRISSLEPPKLEVADGSRNVHGDRFCHDCNTRRTPLWRAGPSGPKTLCNACGIRRRKLRRQNEGPSATWAAYLGLVLNTFTWTMIKLWGQIHLDPKFSWLNLSCLGLAIQHMIKRWCTGTKWLDLWSSSFVKSVSPTVSSISCLLCLLAYVIFLIKTSSRIWLKSFRYMLDVSDTNSSLGSRVKLILKSKENSSKLTKWPSWNFVSRNLFLIMIL